MKEFLKIFHILSPYNTLLKKILLICNYSTYQSVPKWAAITLLYTNVAVHSATEVTKS